MSSFRIVESFCEGEKNDKLACTFFSALSFYPNPILYHSLLQKTAIVVC